MHDLPSLNTLDLVASYIPLALRINVGLEKYARKESSSCCLSNTYGVRYI